MRDSDRVLLDLLGRALFQYKTEYDSAQVDWAEVYREAESQTVSPLVFDCLTKEERAALPEGLEAHWRGRSLQSFVSNEQLKYEQQQVIRALNSAGILSVVLKGTSAAACYPKPELRILGDIDLLVSLERQIEAVEVLQSMGYVHPMKEDDQHHMDLLKGKTVVELHKEPNGIMKAGQTANALREYFHSALDERRIDDGMPVLADEYQAVLLILHKLEHFIHSGLGLRQVCDWAVFVQRRMTPELWAQLKPKLRQFGLLYFTGTITRACVEALHLPAACAPWCMEYDRELSLEVVEELLEAGNFGKKRDDYGSRYFQDVHSGNWLTSFFRVLVSACHHHWPVCKKYPILLPIAPFVAFGKYLRMYWAGERPALRPAKLIRQAGPRRRLYQSLRPFMEDSGDRP